MGARKIYNPDAMSSPLVSALAGSLDYVKEVRDKCAAAGIRAVAAAPHPGRG
jgi:hypothetical protein